MFPVCFLYVSCMFSVCPVCSDTAHTATYRASYRGFYRIKLVWIWGWKIRAILCHTTSITQKQTMSSNQTPMSRMTVAELTAGTRSVPVSMGDIIKEEFGDFSSHTCEGAGMRLGGTNEWEIILEQFYVGDYRIFVVDTDYIKDYLDMFDTPPAMNGFRVIGESTYMKVHYTDKNNWYHCYWSAIKFMCFLGGWVGQRSDGPPAPWQLNHTSEDELKKCKRHYYDWCEYHIAERKMRVIKSIINNGSGGWVAWSVERKQTWNKSTSVPIMGISGSDGSTARIWELSENYVLGLFDDTINVNEEWVETALDKKNGWVQLGKRRGYSFMDDAYFNVDPRGCNWCGPNVAHYGKIGGWVMTTKANMSNYYVSHERWD